LFVLDDHPCSGFPYSLGKISLAASVNVSVRQISFQVASANNAAFCLSLSLLLVPFDSLTVCSFSLLDHLAAVRLKNYVAAHWNNQDENFVGFEVPADVTHPSSFGGGDPAFKEFRSSL
jgi:hypothetical protein